MDRTHLQDANLRAKLKPFIHMVEHAPFCNIAAFSDFHFSFVRRMPHYITALVLCISRKSCEHILNFIFVSFYLFTFSAFVLQACYTHSLRVNLSSLVLWLSYFIWQSFLRIFFFSLHIKYVVALLQSECCTRTLEWMDIYPAGNYECVRCS